MVFILGSPFSVHRSSFPSTAQSLAFGPFLQMQRPRRRWSGRVRVTHSELRLVTAAAALTARLAAGRANRLTGDLLHDGPLDHLAALDLFGHRGADLDAPGGLVRDRLLLVDGHDLGLLLGNALAHRDVDLLLFPDFLVDGAL